MTDAAPDAAREPSRERGWGRVLVGLAAVLLLPATPFLRVLMPVDEPLLLLAAALAACAVVGWWMGGRAWLALLWVGLAAWVLVGPRGAASGFDLLLRAWAVLGATTFAVVLVATRGQSFLGRGLLAVALSLGLGVVSAAVAPSGLPGLQRVVTAEVAARGQRVLADWRAVTSSAEVRAWAAENKLEPVLAQTEQQLAALPTAATVILPAMLALETLVALALAWAVYHRVGRARLGPPLAPLGEFRFSDQLVWGLIAGLAMLVVPGFAAWRGVGANLLLFFGALYAVRGLGVALWFLAPGRLMSALLIVCALLFWNVLAFVALGVGLGDTWMDWRRRVQSSKT